MYVCMILCMNDIFLVLSPFVFVFVSFLFFLFRFFGLGSCLEKEKKRSMIIWSDQIRSDGDDDDDDDDDDAWVPLGLQVGGVRPLFSTGLVGGGGDGA
jgi:hypothetical protein